MVVVVYGWVESPCPTLSFPTSSKISIYLFLLIFDEPCCIVGNGFVFRDCIYVINYCICDVSLWEFFTNICVDYIYLCLMNLKEELCVIIC